LRTPVISPLLHVGFQKTGSTWLQRRLFCSSEAGFAAACSDDALKKHIIKPHDLVFDANACREWFEPRIRAVEERGLVPVLSAERLTGDAHLRGHDSGRIADRLASVFPDAKVLMVIREQRGMILATYKQYVSAGGLLRLQDYLGPNRGMYQWPFELVQFAYDRLIARYLERFGEENVLVLPLELFRREPHDFVSRIVRFTEAAATEEAIARLPFGVVENPARPAMSVVAKRRLNRILRQRLTPWAPLDGHGRTGKALRRLAWKVGTGAPARLNDALEQRMKAMVAEATGNFYRASNARTAELIGIDLRDYGYDMPRAVAEPVPAA
jgi:hypothetical protein